MLLPKVEVPPPRWSWVRLYRRDELPIQAPKSDYPHECLDEIGVGWPWVCLAARQYYTPAGSYSWTDPSGQMVSRSVAYPVYHPSTVLISGIKIPKRFAHGSAWSLPIQPIFPEFAYNTLAYAAPVFAVLWCIPAARAMVRRRRGACGRCGYDLRSVRPTGHGTDIVCPECGPAS